MLRGRSYVPAILVVAAVAIATPACAAQGPLYRYPGPRGSVDTRAYDYGYDDGLRRGEGDARRQRSFDYARHGDYRDADDGYRGGNRNAYREVYRRGFAEGYNAGYRRYARGGYDRGYPNYPNYPNNRTYPAARGRYVSAAAQNGFRDGLEQGREDGRDGDRYDPVRASRYRSGDNDYDRRDGSLDEYKRDYRAAFQQGYDQGYREYRRR
jgi:hypothetical protein